MDGMDVRVCARMRIRGLETSVFIGVLARAIAPYKREVPGSSPGLPIRANPDAGWAYGFRPALLEVGRWRPLASEARGPSCHLAFNR